MALRRQLCVCAVAALIAPARAFVPGTPSRRPALSPLRLIEGHAASMAARMPTKGHAASRCTRMAAGGGGDDGDAAAAEEAPKVLAYRASLGVAALAITTAAVASILSSEGMPIAGTVADDATAAALLASALSIVLCSWASFDLPLLGWPVGGATFRAACFVPLAALGGVHDLHQAAPALAFATALLAGREAYYYGLEYKVEAALAVVAAGAAVATRDDVAFGVWGLLWGVLAAGKVFEPVESDLSPQGSGFLADDAME